MWKTSRSDQMEHTASNMQKWENTRGLWAQRGLTGQHLDDPAAAAGTAQWVKPCTLLSPGPLRPHVDQSTWDSYSHKTRVLAKEGQSVPWLSSSSPQGQGAHPPKGWPSRQFCPAGSPLHGKRKGYMYPKQAVEKLPWLCTNMPRNQNKEGIWRSKDGTHTQTVNLYKNTLHRFWSKPPEWASHQPTVPVNLIRLSGSSNVRRKPLLSVIPN